MQLCEIDLRESLPPESLAPFVEEIKKRGKQRKRLARKVSKRFLYSTVFIEILVALWSSVQFEFNLLCFWSVTLCLSYALCIYVWVLVRGLMRAFTCLVSCIKCVLVGLHLLVPPSAVFLATMREISLSNFFVVVIWQEEVEKAKAEAAALRAIPVPSNRGHSSINDAIFSLDDFEGKYPTPKNCR